MLGKIFIGNLGGLNCYWCNLAHLCDRIVILNLDEFTNNLINSALVGICILGKYRHRTNGILAE